MCSIYKREETIIKEKKKRKNLDINKDKKEGKLKYGKEGVEGYVNNGKEGVEGYVNNGKEGVEGDVNNGIKGRVKKKIQTKGIVERSYRDWENVFGGQSGRICSVKRMESSISRS